MAKYKLKILKTFEEDLFESAWYISEVLDNENAAQRLVDDVEKAIYDRLKMPEAFEPYHSEKERKHEYYRIYVRNYTILYVVINDVMEVRHMFYSGRDFEKLI